MTINIFQENNRLGVRLDELKTEFEKLNAKKNKTEKDEEVLEFKANEIRKLQESFDRTMEFFFPGVNL